MSPYGRAFTYGPLVHRICCGDPKQFGNSTIKLLGVIDLQNPKCIKRIKQYQLCYAGKSPTDEAEVKFHMEIDHHI